MTDRSDERAEFLATILTTAIEGGINYWGSVEAYEWGFADLGTSKGDPLAEGTQPYATAKVWEDDSDDTTPFDVDIETIAKGLNLLRTDHLHRLLPESTARNILLADRTNGEDGDIDAGDADVILQLGMFGEVVYG